MTGRPPRERHAAGVGASAAGRPVVAVRHLRAALRRVEAGRDAELRARIMVSLAWAEAERGRISAGFRLLDDAEPLFPPERRGVLLGQRGLLLRRTGQDAAALAQYDAAIAGLAEPDEAEDLAKALSNRALVHLGAARIGAARADLHRSANIAARHGLALPAAVAGHNLADLDLLRGDIPAALRGYAAAGRGYARLAPGKLASVAIDLARALLAAGLFGEADRQLAVAMSRAREQRLSHVYADAVLARAETALLAGDTAAAARWAGQARTCFLRRTNARRAALASLIALRAGQAGGPPSAALAARASDLAGTLRGLGLPEDARVAELVGVRVLAALGQPDAAQACLRRAGPPRGTERLDTRLLSRLGRAELAAAAGRRADAGRELRTGMAALHRYRSRLGCLDLQTGAAVHGRDLARAGLSAALAAGSAASVFRWSERGRAQALLLPPAAPPDDPDDPDAPAALEQLRQVRHALRAAELAGRPAGPLRGQELALRQQVRQSAWGAGGQAGGAPGSQVGGPPGSTVPPATLAAVRAGLGDAAMLVYLRDGPALHVLVLAGRRTRIVPLGRYARVQEMLLRLRADLDAQAGLEASTPLAGAVAGAVRQDAAALAALLLAPVRALAGDRELVIVPAGILVTVPWAVLCGPGRAVTVAPSAATWLAARRRAAGGRLDERATALLAAGPGIDRGADEIARIAAMRPDAVVLAGPAATPAATLALMDGTDVVHLAAHGSHQPDNALFSALELSGGPLMGYDAVRMRAAPRLVVLSCCSLGLADVRPGDETLGMTTALLQAGTPTVIASVARVADAAAMRITTALHAALRRGAPPACALARAEPSGFVCFGAG
ncbi:MAG TPA: CHAT domain-containing protein [Streptosporangiaceae bacterium]